MTRAEFLRLALGASAGWCVADRLSKQLAAEQAPAAVGDGIEARAADVVRAYDAQGIHRTATEVDNRSAANCSMMNWL